MSTRTLAKTPAIAAAKRAVPLGLLSCALVLAACTDEAALTGPDGIPPPVFAISDAAHDGFGGFYWLSPMVDDPTATGEFDPALAPRVEICEWDGGCAAVVAEFVSSGVGADAIVVNQAAEYYGVNWRTGRFDLDLDATYRIRVFVEEQRFGTDALLGYADVRPVRTGRELKDVDAGDYVGVINGSTLRIRFRIETGIVGSVVIEPEEIVLVPGAVQHYEADLADLHGHPIAASVAWATDDTGVAIVQQAQTGDGLFEVLALAIADGETHISATAGPASATARIIVFRPISPPGSPVLENRADNRLPEASRFTIAWDRSPDDMADGGPAAGYEVRVASGEEGASLFATVPATGEETYEILYPDQADPPGAFLGLHGVGYTVVVRVLDTRVVPDGLDLDPDHADSEPTTIVAADLVASPPAFIATNPTQHSPSASPAYLFGPDEISAVHFAGADLSFQQTSEAPKTLPNGETYEGGLITVTVGDGAGAVSGTAEVDEAGDWSVTLDLSSLPNGVYTVTAVQDDRRGNVSEPGHVLKAPGGDPTTIEVAQSVATTIEVIPEVAHLTSFHDEAVFEAIVRDQFGTVMEDAFVNWGGGAEGIEAFPGGPGNTTLHVKAIESQQWYSSPSALAFSIRAEAWPTVGIFADAHVIAEIQWPSITDYHASTTTLVLDGDPIEYSLTVRNPGGFPAVRTEAFIVQFTEQGIAWRSADLDGENIGSCSDLCEIGLSVLASNDLPGSGTLQPGPATLSIALGPSTGWPGFGQLGDGIEVPIEIVQGDPTP